jgi:multiple sugar transport system substrate-binding protein
MRRISWKAALATGLTGALVLTGCGGGSGAGGPSAEGAGDFSEEYDGPDVTLAYWNGFTGGDGPFMEDLVDQFMEEHDNITIESNTIQWADFYQRVPAAVQAGQGPDVGVMHLDQLATHAARNIIVPVDDLAEGIGLTEDDFTPEIWNAGIYNDQRYGIPLDVHSLAMFYNTEHFEQAGITEPPTDEASFMEALDALKAAGFDTPFWMPTLWPSHLIYLSLMWQQGEEPYGEDGTEAAYDSEAGIAALEWQRSIVEQGYSPPNIAIDAQYVDRMERDLADQRPRGGRRPVRDRSAPDDLRRAGAVGELAPLLHQPAGRRRREQGGRSPGVHRVDERALG